MNAPNIKPPRNLQQAAQWLADATRAHAEERERPYDKWRRFDAKQANFRLVMPMWQPSANTIFADLCGNWQGCKAWWLGMAETFVRTGKTEQSTACECRS